MTDFIKRRLRGTITKELLIDLEDRLRAEAVKAFEMVRDGAGLNKKRARELEGQARFRMMEEGFESICLLHGGRLLDGGVIPNTEFKVFQPFMRFEGEGKGIILGLAAMPEPKVVPQKNLSRRSGVTMNYQLSPRLDFDGASLKIEDIFVLFMVARSRERAGQIQEMAIGVVDSKYTSFLYYEPIDQFLSGAADAPETSSSPVAGPAPTPSISLKPNVKPFVPPEAPKPKKEGEGSDKE